MKKLNLIFLLMIFAMFCTFGQEAEKPLVMYELGSGYGFGINMDSSIPLEIRMILPFDRIFFTLAGGADFAEKIGGHGNIGVGYFIINTDKTRIPLSLGFTISGNSNHFYLGVAAMLSYHYIITDNLYASINLEAVYNFNDRYMDFTGNGKGSDAKSFDGSGNPITIFSPAKTGMINHWGSYIHIKPTISIGYQFK